MSSITRRLAALALLVFAFLVVPRVARAEAPAPSMAGRFVYAGGAREDALRKAAIDQGIEAMFFAIRPIARYRLGNSTRILPWISFGFEGATIRTRGPEKLDFASPNGGAPVLHTWREEHCRVTQRLTANGMVQRMVADDGAGENVWTLSPDGSTLTVQITITSPHLPKTIRYALTYRRES